MRDQRKLRVAARAAALYLPASLPPALFLTDEARTPDPGAVAKRLPAGWGVVYRARAPKLDEAKCLAALCRARGLAFLVAGDPRLAFAVKADGVHWPETRAAESRCWADAFPLMMASAHSRAALARLARLPIDAALRSVVFPSASPSAGKHMGALKFRAEARASPLPVYALGGVTAQTAPRIANAAGLAAIEGFASAFDRK